VAFCERMDQNSFDPDYGLLPIERFASRVQEIFVRDPSDPLYGTIGCLQTTYNKKPIKI
jgi:hypothetical protein